MLWCTITCKWPVIFLPLELVTRVYHKSLSIEAVIEQLYHFTPFPLIQDLTLPPPPFPEGGICVAGPIQGLCGVCVCV